MEISLVFLGIMSIILMFFHRPERKQTSAGSHYRKVRIELSAVKYRRDVFSQVKLGEWINIKPDPSRGYNGQAIGAFTQSGKLLGYIPRDQRRLIMTFRYNPDSPAMIYRKFHRGGHFSILIDVFLPTPQNPFGQKPNDRLNS